MASSVISKRTRDERNVIGELGNTLGTLRLTTVVPNLPAIPNLPIETISVWPPGVLKVIHGEASHIPLPSGLEYERLPIKQLYEIVRRVPDPNPIVQWRALLRLFVQSPEFWIARGGDFIHDFLVPFRNNYPINPNKKSMVQYFSAELQKQKRDDNTIDVDQILKYYTDFTNSHDNIKAHLSTFGLNDFGCEPIARTNEALSQLTKTLLREGVEFFCFDAQFGNIFNDGFGQKMSCIVSAPTILDGATKISEKSLHKYQINTINDLDTFTVPDYLPGVDLEFVVNKKTKNRSITIHNRGTPNQCTVTTTSSVCINGLATFLGVPLATSTGSTTLAYRADSVDDYPWKSQQVFMLKSSTDWAQLVYTLLLNKMGIKTVFITNDHICLAFAAALHLPYVILTPNTTATHIEFFRFDADSLTLSPEQMDIISRKLSTSHEHLEPIYKKIKEIYEISMGRIVYCMTQFLIPPDISDAIELHASQDFARISRLLSEFNGGPHPVGKINRFNSLIYMSVEKFFDYELTKYMNQFYMKFMNLARIFQPRNFKNDPLIIAQIITELKGIFSIDNMETKLIRTLNLINFGKYEIVRIDASLENDWRNRIKAMITKVEPIVGDNYITVTSGFDRVDPTLASFIQDRYNKLVADGILPVPRSSRTHLITYISCTDIHAKLQRIIWEFTNSVLKDKIKTPAKSGPACVLPIRASVPYTFPTAVSSSGDWENGDSEGTGSSNHRDRRENLFAGPVRTAFATTAVSPVVVAGPPVRTAFATPAVAQEEPLNLPLDRITLGPNIDAYYNYNQPPVENVPPTVSSSPYYRRPSVRQRPNETRKKGFLSATGRIRKPKSRTVRTTKMDRRTRKLRTLKKTYDELLDRIEAPKAYVAPPPQQQMVEPNQLDQSFIDQFRRIELPLSLSLSDDSEKEKEKEEEENREMQARVDVLADRLQQMGGGTTQRTPGVFHISKTDRRKIEKELKYLQESSSSSAPDYFFKGACTPEPELLLKETVDNVANIPDQILRVLQSLATDAQETNMLLEFNVAIGDVMDLIDQTENGLITPETLRDQFYFLFFRHPVFSSLLECIPHSGKQQLVHWAQQIGSMKRDVASGIPQNIRHRKHQEWLTRKTRKHRVTIKKPVFVYTGIRA